MDYKFLNKVVDQIISETIMDYDRKVIETPFFTPPSPPLFSFLSFYLLAPSRLSFRFFFTDHCRDVYGLNDNEVKYVWVEYIQIIKDKIENNGL